MIDEKKRIDREVKKLLKEALTNVNFEQEVVKVEDEDGEFYYTLRPKTKLTYELVDALDNTLIACAKFYRDSGVLNSSRYYFKVARMIHYAMGELEAREPLQNMIAEILGLKVEDVDV